MKKMLVILGVIIVAVILFKDKIMTSINSMMGKSSTN